MRPHTIVDRGRRLAAILHARDEAAGAAPTALLVCAPLGQEAVRVHRLQRVLCDQLLRVGIPSLRFDYFGAGESSGENEQADLAGWTDDVIAADRALREACGARRVIWLGARLGGSLALLAACRADPASRPAALVLWEPVVDGGAYLEALAADHERALQASHGPFLRRARARGPAAGRAPRDGSHPTQVIGFGLSDAMRGQMRALVAPAPPATVSVAAIAPPATDDVGRLAAPFDDWIAGAVAEAGAERRRLPLQHAFDWTAEDALNTALVPAPVVRLMRQQIEAWR